MTNGRSIKITENTERLWIVKKKKKVLTGLIPFELYVSNLTLVISLSQKTLTKSEE